MAKKSLPVQLTERTPLQEVIPLDSPYSVLLSPTDYCNIKCVFCPFHGKVKDGSLRKPEIMSFDLYKTIIDQLTEFPNKLRALIFCGRGEPTLHKNLPEMIRYAKEKNITDSIRLTTNGFNLSPELNRRLIDAGLDYMKISVPAIDKQTCFDVTGVMFDLEKYIGNIRHLYESKGDNMTIYCNIKNVALGGIGRGEPIPVLAEQFYSMFDKICDYCHIENIVPQVIRNLTKNELREMWIENFEWKSIYNFSDNFETSVCERLFYHFTVNSIGNVFPCDLNEKEGQLLGNVKNTTLQKIWNGDILNKLRIAFLKGETPLSCAECSVIKYDYPNNLHKYADILCRRLLNE